MRGRRHRVAPRSSTGPAEPNLDPRHLTPRTEPRYAAASAWASAVCAACAWFATLLRVAPGFPGTAVPPAVAAAAGLATQLAISALESSAAVAAWTALGRRARWSRLAPALFTASLTEAVAVWITAGGPSVPSGWQVALAGWRAHPDAPPADALAQSCAGFGFLAMLRLVLSMQAHADELRAAAAPGRAPARRRAWREAALLVLASYTVTRLALWWGLDLLRGRSFEPGGGP